MDADGGFFMELRMARSRFSGLAVLVICFCLVMEGCGSADHAAPLPVPHGNSGNGVGSVPNLPPSVPSPNPPPSASTTNYNSAVWVKVKNSNTWTDAVIAAVDSQITSFERARDVEDFCPGYSKASKHSHETCWLRLIGGVVEFESSFNPTDSFKEPSGDMSVGLLALSPNECANAPTEAALKDPVKNLVCGITIMARLIATDGFIDGPVSGRGASAYWSTLRAPYILGKYHLGKKDQIVSITKLYSAY
jgi:hypothetical protein